MGALKKTLLAAATLAGLGLAAMKATGQPTKKKAAPKARTKAPTKTAKKAVRRAPAKGARKKSPRAA